MQKAFNSQQNCSCRKSEITGERIETREGNAMRWAALGLIQMS